MLGKLSTLTVQDSATERLLHTSLPGKYSYLDFEKSQEFH